MKIKNENFILELVKEHNYVYIHIHFMYIFVHLIIHMKNKIMRKLD